MFKFGKRERVVIGKGNERGFWEVCNALFLHLDSGYTSALTDNSLTCKLM